jgi:ATP-dependent RNA helicase SUPV3L1/SUV3
MPRRPLLPAERGRNVTAVLGPTNTGKTHLAIERMVAQGNGLIGLPLRLLAREVYQRLVEKVGAEKVALITGEEKINPKNARYWVSTIEAMPQDLEVDFVAIDEIQIAADLDRGHVFTDRVLNRRGRHETLLLGASTMRGLVERLLPGANIVGRPRLSNLTFAGEKKLTRLPRRSAIVAFSAEEVYAIAELIRRQRGGAAVVLGALSPRTRNAQVELYQSGDVEYLVATDAIGMGLNLDVDHIAFAGDRKFDGFQFRRLNPSEFGQIAGRAGRHLRDGTFGTTGRCPPFENELVERLEGHNFESVRLMQWRNTDLDFSSIAMLQLSLAVSPTEAGLTRAPTGEDVTALEYAVRDPEVRGLATGSDAIQRLWDVCQVPDYRKVSPAAHAELATSLYGFLMREGKIPDDWFARQVALGDRTDGDIDTLSARIAHIRTWTFVANRLDWLADPEHWQGVARGVEDKLSDALHERLTQRFVDRRSSVLMRRLRDKDMLEAEVTDKGDVLVEGQHVGSLAAFRFTADQSAEGEDGRALRAAAQKALAGEFTRRADKLAAAPDAELVLSSDGTLRWLGEPVGRLAAGEHILRPRTRILADDSLAGPDREKAEARLQLWIDAHVKRLLGPLFDLEATVSLTGIARGLAFQVAENLGVLDRARVADEVKGLEQDARASLRKLGLRFGAYHIYLPLLLKPAPRALAAQLWALKQDHAVAGFDDIPALAASGRTSFKADPAVSQDLYRALGYRLCQDRAVRVDILERLADLIRPAIAYRAGVTPGEPPAGAADGNGFTVTVAMTSLTGCSGEDFSAILRALGYRLDRRPAPKPGAAPAGTDVPTEAAAETAPETNVEATPEADAAVADEVIEAPAETPAEALLAEFAGGTPGDTAVATEAAAGADTASEPVMIDIWRPGRQEHRRPDNRRPDNRAPNNRGADQKKRFERGGNRGADAGANAAPTSDDGKPRPPRRPDRDGQKNFKGGYKGGQKGDGPRGEGQRGGRPPRRDDQRRDDHNDTQRTAPPPRRDKPADPNSPFAALAGLKAQLEADKPKT